MQPSPLILPSHLLRYGTFCSGIEAVSVAWDGLGWHPVFFSEIDRFPCAVLKDRHPNVPNLGDMLLVDGKLLQGLLDIIVAGTPCQSFSIAGLRMGLSDERGNLTLELVKIYDASKTAYLLWENVPGVLSDKGNAFGCFLGALSGKTRHYSHQGANGRTLVMCLDPKGQSHGESWMPNISAWPNAAAVSFLSQVLETGPIPARFYLSSTACAGILRRAEKKRRTLPEPLKRALAEVAEQEQAQQPL